MRRRSPEQDRRPSPPQQMGRRSPPHPDAPAGTAEWKSFLGKKVRAESAAAARQESQKKDAPSMSSRPTSRDAPPAPAGRSNWAPDPASQNQPPAPPPPKTRPGHRDAPPPMTRPSNPNYAHTEPRAADDERDSLFDFRSSASSAVKSRNGSTPVSEQTVSAAKQSFKDRSGRRVADRSERRGKNYGQPHFVEQGEDRRGASYGQPHYVNDNDVMEESNFSDISPIPVEETSFDQTMERASDTGTAIEQGTFFKRLQACAAPIIPRQFLPSEEPKGDLPSAHLAFMKSNPQPTSSTLSSGANSRSTKKKEIPSSLLGRPDTILEDGDEAESSYQTPKSRSSSSRNEGRSSSGKRNRQRSPKDTSDARSTASLSSADGFGARTSYLEAIAMKAAVSKPKRSGSRGKDRDERSRSSARSDVSSSSRRGGSERWQEFLDRKGASVSPTKARGDKSDVSKAAEKYAAEKVEEMMSVMATNPKSKNRIEDMIEIHSSSGAPEIVSPYELARSSGSRTKSTISSGSRTKSTVSSGGMKANPHDSAKAAEELAAARVEAMMAAMTTTNLDEGEI